jgi:very-short-patch-repair endonuclease
LRSRKLNGLKFRRQVPVGHYIADFLCIETKVILELDGPSHDESEEEDVRRTRWLNEQGYRVVRFLNEHVQQDIDAVLRTILRECGLPCD